MKKIKEFLKRYWWIILAALIILGLFYWYQIRPSFIYSRCNKEAQENARSVLSPRYEEYYKSCLRRHGINK